MKNFLLILLLAMSGINAVAQTTTEKPHIYNPQADAAADIRTAVKQAAKEHKHVFVQVGGNWCIWCVRFHNLVHSDTMLTRIMNENYVVVHVNYSPENKNEKVLAQLEYPQRFGYPVFVILDAKGKRLHTQNSGYLEEGKGHSAKKVAEFLNHWSPAALDPKNYTEQK